MPRQWKRQLAEGGLPQRSDDAAPPVDQGRASPAVLPLVEVTAMTAVLLSYIWLWRGRLAGSDAACLVLYFGIGIAGHRYRRESVRQIGLRVDNLRVAALDALRLAVPIVAMILAIGILTGSIDFPPIESWPVRLGSGWLLGHHAAVRRHRVLLPAVS